MGLSEEFRKGFWDENPLLKLLLGLCPTLAVSTEAINGIGMGLATTFVLMCSNMLVAYLRDFIPSKVRIASFVVIIASFVTIVDLVMEAYFFSLHKALGLFIPLIVVNCIILGRAEAFASKNPVAESAVDGLGMGLGFTWALTVLGAVRELLGNGSVFGWSVLGTAYKPILLMILPPGAFIALGFMLAAEYKISEKRGK
ncbi:MAG: electron transport complex subunit RsxE [bacterium]